MGDARTMGQSERLMLQVAELESHSCLSPLMMPLAADAGPGLQGWVSVCPTGFGLAFLVVPPSPPLTDSVWSNIRNMECNYFIGAHT